MYAQYIISLAGLLLSLLALSACSGTASLSVSERLSDYTTEISRLERKLASEPNSISALRKLGVIYVRTNNPRDAIGLLRRAHNLGGRDPKLLFYLAFSEESLGLRSEALALYGTFTTVARSSPYRRLMSGRYFSLSREIAAESVRRSLEADKAIPASEIADNALAVFAMEYQGVDDTYAYLGRGLAEWIVLDLTKVNELRVVERIRLQALLDELDLQRTGYVDPDTAPRAGRLLRAGRVVSGSFNVTSNDRLQVTVAHIETNTNDIGTLPSLTDDLEEFFTIEKRIVFALIEDLGIQLTEAERQAIDAVPTRNLQAFLAYCRGLTSEDQQDFRAASVYFEEAARLDPEFDAASTRMDISLGMEATFGDIRHTLASAIDVEPLFGALFNPVAARLERLGESLEAPLVPGPDARKPAVDAFLPGPPPPPSPPNN